MSAVTKTMDDLSHDQENLLKWHGKGFDFRTHITDPKTGQKIRIQPYSMVIDKTAAISEYFIRDGKKWNRNGVEIQTQTAGQQQHGKK